MNLFKFGQEKKAKVKDFAGLKGKVVNIGNPGSGQRGTMEELMKAMGADMSMFKGTTELTSSQQVKALCDGKIDAFGYSLVFLTEQWKKQLRVQQKQCLLILQVDLFKV